MRILVLNSGSSSLKTALYEIHPDQMEQLPPPEPASKSSVGRLDPIDTVLEASKPIDAVGHRIVHGGSRYRTATKVTSEVREDLRALAEIDPMHAPQALAIIDKVQALDPGIPQIAVFDTGFHATLAPPAYTYAIPSRWREQEGIRRYGFHGLSFQYSTRRAAQLVGKHQIERLLICHLGSGASLCAVKDGKSVDTTMGFTPLEGLVMSTRSGTVDPGILIHLDRKGYDLDHALNHESGLAGLSGTSGDMREVLAARAKGDSLAFDVFIHRLAREAGGMVASMGGLDSIVFTGGIGEHSPEVRQEVCEKLGFLGVLIDLEKNAHVTADCALQAETATVRILMIQAQEEWEIARECARLV